MTLSTILDTSPGAAAVLMDPEARELHDLEFGCLDSIIYIQVQAGGTCRGLTLTQCYRKAGRPTSNTHQPLQDYLLRYFYMLFSIQGLGLQVKTRDAQCCLHAVLITSRCF